MLFFIDESWQETPDGNKVGVLAAVQIKAHDFNECSKQIHLLKVKHIGPKAGNVEIKGTKVLKDYSFRLEEKGIKSTDLAIAKAIIDHMSHLGVALFASVVFSKEELNLACHDAQNLDRPFFFLFERINLFMEENYPDLRAKLIFDDRDYETNKRVSDSVSNFLNKSPAGHKFDKIIKAPTFAISSNNVGLQMADLVAHILGKRAAGNKNIRPYDKAIKSMEFKSKKLFRVKERDYPLFGFKTIKDNKKEAGDLVSPERT